MKRTIDNTLIQWKTKKTRLPLLVRGARQVGKSYTVSTFGNNHFENMVEINFEESPEYIGCFEEFDIQGILDKISILTNAQIIPGQTLLFPDEIQDCPRAITALRYFQEKLPQLHIIGAGSLIEFALKSEQFRMPLWHPFLHA